MAVPKARLRDETVVQRTVDGTRYATVYDHTLDTAYVYRNPRMKTISSAPGGVTVAGETFEADSLPLERQIGYDAIWMAWYGYYPSTEVHR